MNATETTTLPLPSWLEAEVSKSGREAVFEHGVPVRPEWWWRALGAVGRDDEMFECRNDELLRADLFALGASATSSRIEARRLLWACLAWGTGTRARNNSARIDAVHADPERLSDLLVDAAGKARDEPVAAYDVLMPNHNAIKYLGPPFFTKFLYFAGAGDAAHQSLILDSVVAEVMRKDCGWASLLPSPTYRWPSWTYGRYCALLARWASEIAARRGIPVMADQLELCLFSHKPVVQD